MRNKRYTVGGRMAILFLAVLLMAGATARADSPRQRLSADFGWRFKLGDVTSGQDPALDDSAWRTVNLPHDWSIEGDYNRSNPTASNGGFLPAGIGWYRRHFTPPDSARARRIVVEFDGVYMDSQVCLNGRLLGGWVNGYTSFQLDMTPAIKFGQDNVLAVRVDNSKQPYGRWYSGSGIDRHVWVTIEDPLHVDQWGTYVTTPQATSRSATVRIHTDVRNDGGAIANADLQSDLIDPDGKLVSSADGAQSILGNAIGSFDQTINLSSPRLWSIESPILYRVHTTVKSGGTIVDEYDTPIGVRQIAFDADRGFLLNGEHVKIKGVCLHHDAGSVGAAVPVAMLRRRLDILKQMGCNAIRCSHNPPAPEFLDLCDQMGFVVMDEAFDEWEQHKINSPYGYSDYFDQWWQRDLSAMLRRDRNHPSIVLWSIGNEIPDQSTARGAQVATQLAGMCHALDPTRFVTSACDNVNTDNPANNTRLDFLAQLDVAGYNYADRWGIRRELQYEPDKILYPQRKFIGTEDSGMGGARGQYAFTLFGGSARDRANYAANIIEGEQVWKFVALHDYVAGNFIWTGIDYLGEGGRGSSSGAIDTCGFPKDGFYFYQSQWTGKPMIHLFPHWTWPGFEGRTIPVLCFTNCSTVELFLNDKSLGAKAMELPRLGSAGGWNTPAQTPINPTTTDLHLSWDVPYVPGTLRAVGYDRAGKEACTETLKTSGSPAAVALSADRTTLDADGRDVVHVTASIVDSNGELVPTASTPLTFDVSGVGTLVGTDNGNLQDTSNFKSRARNAFNGLALAVVQTTRDAGRIHIVIHANGLKDGIIDIDSKAASATALLP